MPDGLFDLLFIFVLLLPILGALGSGIMKWWRAASSQEMKGAEGRAAKVEAVGLFPDEANYRLRLTNKGAGPAQDVHVYVNRRPISEHQKGEGAEPHPWPMVGPGQTISYRCAVNRWSGRDRALVRVEWEDATGGGMEQTTVRVS